VNAAYRFRIKWDGRYVAAVASVHGLSRSQQPQPAHKIPGQADYEPVRLERGIITDSAFEDWANQLWRHPNTAESGEDLSLSSFRKDMQVELYNEVGQPILRFNLHNCWPSEYTALPELDADANTVALASMTIEHEGWERDPTLTPPAP
jgi:phage tail-like protein